MAYERQFENGGALFPLRRKNSDRSPDFAGDFTIDGELLDYIMELMQNGERVKLGIIAWKRQGRSGSSFLSLSIKEPLPDRDEARPSFQGGGDRPLRPQRPQASPNEGHRREGGYGQRTRPAAYGEVKGKQVPSYPQTQPPERRARTDPDNIPFDDEFPSWGNPQDTPPWDE